MIKEVRKSYEKASKYLAGKGLFDLAAEAAKNARLAKKAEVYKKIAELFSIHYRTL